MATRKLVVIVRDPSNDDEFLIVQQPRPTRFGDDEYDSFLDSDLWDLPSAVLQPLEGQSHSEIELDGVDRCPEKISLRNFDFSLALKKVSEQLGFQKFEDERWKFWKYVEEPEFGPGSPIQTVFIVGHSAFSCDINPVACQWTSKQQCLDWLLNVEQRSFRIGPSVVVGLLNDSSQCIKLDVPQSLRYQEYPPGVTLVPMGSRTGLPFRTTNLVIFAPPAVSQNCDDGRFIASGDALIVDPGCLPQFHEELAQIVSSLPRKLIVFVTHHHHDHVDGLSVVQRCNPGAVLLAHKNTMGRIEKGDWSLGYTSVSGGEEICVGGERLRVIFAPGHTDGHMGLHHLGTNCLIVGDHCVGEGSAALDGNAGGNMVEYFQTTYKFMELSPSVLVPIHGRVNMWPKHMLCGYLKNRRSRESAILKAILSGANTLYDVVAAVYSGVDHRAWTAAGSNVMLHVEHLAQQKKLPEGFSLENFNESRSAFSNKLSALLTH